MKLCSQSLKAHLSNKLTYMATCWKLVLNNNTIVAVSNCETFLKIDNITYNPNTDFSQKAIISSLFPFYDTTIIEGVCDERIIKEDDILKGYYTNARIEIFTINYTDLSQETILLFSGEIEKIGIDNKKFIAELNGKNKKLFKQIGESFSPLCRAEFCDKRCKLNKEKYIINGTVTKIISPSEFQDETLTREATYYQYESILFKTGSNINNSRRIKNLINQTIYLSSELSLPINIGDQYSIFIYCDKTLKTCINTFNNEQNFRGEPHVPDLKLFY